MVQQEQAEASWEQVLEGQSGRGWIGFPGAQSWGSHCPLQAKSSRNEKARRSHLVLQAEGPGRLRDGPEQAALGKRPVRAGGSQSGLRGPRLMAV